MPPLDLICQNFINQPVLSHHRQALEFPRRNLDRIHRPAAAGYILYLLSHQHLFFPMHSPCSGRSTSSRDGPNASVNFSNTYRSFSLRCSGGCSRTSSPEVRLNRRKGMDVRGRTRGSVWRGNMVRSGDGDVVGIGLGCRCFTRRWGRGVRDVVDTR